MEKARKKIRLTIEMYIDTDEYPNLTAKEVEQSIILQDSDVIDGFEITTCHPDLDNTSDFVLKNGVIVEKELISEVQSEEIDYKQEVIDSVDDDFEEIIAMGGTYSVKTKKSSIANEQSCINNNKQY
jgi:hypothetical protein